MLADQPFTVVFLVNIAPRTQYCPTKLLMIGYHLQLQLNLSKEQDYVNVKKKVENPWNNTIHIMTTANHSFSLSQFIENDVDTNMR